MLSTTSITISLQVGNLAEAIAWYRVILEADPTLEPVADIVEYEIHPGCWLQLAIGTRPSGGATIRFGVLDLEYTHRRFRGHGLPVSSIKYIEGVITFFDLIDPWQNQLSFYRVLSTE